MSQKTIPDTVPAEFWALIAASRGDSQRFRELLKKMSREEIIHFYWTYEALANLLRTERHWSHVDPDLSEDGLAELANWVVAQGKEYYRDVLEHPERIPRSKDDAGLLSEAVEEYEQRYDDDIPANPHEWDDEWQQHGTKSPWS